MPDYDTPSLNAPLNASDTKTDPTAEAEENKRQEKRGMIISLCALLLSVPALVGA